MLMQKIGLPQYSGLMPEQIAAGQNFDKIFARLVNLRQEGRGSTNAWLDNYEAGNPSRKLSQLGAQGVTHWLQGNVDSENLIGSQWNKYFQSHPDQQGQYIRWITTSRNGHRQL